MALFKRGYKALEEERKRQEERRKRTQNRLFNLFLSEDREECEVIFLTEEPVTFYVHTQPAVINGKTIYKDILCLRDSLGEDCEFCNNGERSTFKGAYLVVDKREYSYIDKEGKEQTVKNQVKLYIQGTKILSQLERLSQKYGLTKYEYNIVRMGKGQGTSYMFERGDEVKLTKKEIEDLLPEFLRDKYDGTIESLMTIVEEQIMLLSPESADLGDNNEEDDYDEEMQDKLISVDEEEEEEVQQNKSKKKTKLNLKKGKSNNYVEDSRKPRIKTVLKKK